MIWENGGVLIPLHKNQVYCNKNQIYLPSSHSFFQLLSFFCLLSFPLLTSFFLLCPLTGLPLLHSSVSPPHCCVCACVCVSMWEWMGMYQNERRFSMTNDSTPPPPSPPHPSSNPLNSNIHLHSQIQAPLCCPPPSKNNPLEAYVPPPDPASASHGPQVSGLCLGTVSCSQVLVLFLLNKWTPQLLVENKNIICLNVMRKCNMSTKVLSGSLNVH